MQIILHFLTIFGYFLAIFSPPQHKKSDHPAGQSLLTYALQ